MCTEDSQQAPACYSADITSFQMCFMHMAQCPTIIHCYQIFLFFNESVMGLANIFVLYFCVGLWGIQLLMKLLCWNCVLLLCFALQEQILKFLLCKVIPKHAAGDISHLSIHTDLQELKKSNSPETRNLH